jgi:phosphoglycolate phosphatase
MTRTVIFDLDGTLADTSGDLIAAANACFMALGHGEVLNVAQDAGTALRGGRAMLTLGFRRLGIAEAALPAHVDPQYPALLEHYAGALDHHTRFYPGALEAVEALRGKGFAVAICTNKPEGLADSLMRSMGARDMFGALIGADTLSTRKPDPAPFFAAIDQSGGARNRAMMIGDTITDHSTARAAGAASVLVTFGPDGTAAIADLVPDAWLDHFDDLPDLAERMLGTA